MVTKSLFQKIAVSFMILLISLPFADICAQSYRGSTEWNNAVRSTRERRSRSIRNQQFFDELWRPKNDKQIKNKDEEQKNVSEKATQSDVEVNAADKSSLSKGDVELVVIAEGDTKEQAIQAALRNAIEQTFGVFVSSHTEILNDNVVKDEIATVASGNIRHFVCLSEEYVDSKCLVTVKAIVSTNNLINYTKSKGGSAELAGSTFAANIKLMELYKNNEIKAIRHLAYQLAEVAPSMFDYNIEIGEFKIYGSSYFCPISIKRSVNANAKKMYDIIYSTLKSLSMTSIEWSKNDKMGIRGPRVCLSEEEPYNVISYIEENHPFYLRSHDALRELKVLQNWIAYCSMNYKIIIDGIGEYEMTFIPPSEKSQSGDDIYPVSACNYSGELYFRLQNKNIVSDHSKGYDYYGKGWLLAEEHYYPVSIPMPLLGGYYETKADLSFSNVDEISKISNIRVERITPKLSYSDFYKNIENYF